MPCSASGHGRLGASESLKLTIPGTSSRKKSPTLSGGPAPEAGPEPNLNQSCSAKALSTAAAGSLSTPAPEIRLGLPNRESLITRTVHNPRCRALRVRPIPSHWQVGTRATSDRGHRAENDAGDGCAVYTGVGTGDVQPVGTAVGPGCVPTGTRNWDLAGPKPESDS